MSEPYRPLAIAFGVVLLWLALFDVFQSVLVPRPVGRRLRLSSLMSVVGWSIFRTLSERYDEERREAFLGTFAPLLVICFLLAWVVECMCAYALIFYGLGPEVHGVGSFGDGFYFAGTSMLTIGYGDMVPVGGWARGLALLAGATGLGLFAVVITFLFSIFGSFQQREVFVLLVGERADAPPSGVSLLVNYAKADAIGELPALFRQAQDWTAMVAESHMAYPVLAYFRSNHDQLSWVAVFGALMDAANLLFTACEGQTPAEARFMLRLGRHVVRDLRNYFLSLRPRRAQLLRGESLGAGVDRAEFDAAHQRLSKAGLRMRDPEIGYKLFSAVRATYAPALNAIAQWWRIPPTDWIGDRSLLALSHAPSLDPAVVQMIEKLELQDVAASASAPHG